MTTTEKQAVLDKVSFPVRELSVIKAEGDMDYSDGVGKKQHIIIPNRKAIYREDTGKILALPSKKYVLVPHGEVVESVFEALDKEKIDYVPTQTQLIADGAHMYVHLQTPEVYTIGDMSDEVKMEIVIRNSYDGSTPFGMELGGSRLVCSNGMRVYRKDLSINKKHYSFNPQDIIEDFMKQVKRFKETFIPFMQTCARMEITAQEAITLIDSLQIAKKYQKATLIQWDVERKELGQNYWAFYNAITYVATHVVKSYMVRRGVEAEAYQIVNERIGT